MYEYVEHSPLNLANLYRSSPVPELLTDNDYRNSRQQQQRSQQLRQKQQQLAQQQQLYRQLTLPNSNPEIPAKKRRGYAEYTKKTTDQELINKLYGCIYGAIVGDAIGARYEFLESRKAKEQVAVDFKDGITILGGGWLKIQAGQITDDSELMLSLLSSIAELKTYDQEHVAQKYILWYKTEPIDVGKTIKNSLSTRVDSKDSKDMIDISREVNSSSLSNGVLMRIAPIGILSYTLSSKDIRSIVSDECDLTHPNPVIKEAAFIYCLCIKYLLKKLDTMELMQKLINKAQIPSVKTILMYAIRQIDEIPVNKEDIFIKTDDRRYQGYFGVALQNAFYELVHCDNYNEGIINIIKRGGDTDTNCVIAGALLGAKFGIYSVDVNLIKQIESTDIPRYQQYTFLSPSLTIERINKIFNIEKSEELQ